VITFTRPFESVWMVIWFGVDAPTGPSITMTPGVGAGGATRCPFPSKVMMLPGGTVVKFSDAFGIVRSRMYGIGVGVGGGGAVEGVGSHALTTCMDSPEAAGVTTTWPTALRRTARILSARSVDWMSRAAPVSWARRIALAIQGLATAARIPMIPTTMTASTSVNPASWRARRSDFGAPPDGCANTSNSLHPVRRSSVLVG
jgi:hypothetical protein